MAITNSLKRQVDLPVFEWCRFSPVVSTSLSATTYANQGNYHPIQGRYVYYLIAATNFWRYDTWADSWEQLTSPPITPATWSDIQIAQSHGFEGRVLGATATTLTIPAYVGQALASYDVTIVSGTGAGQKRVIKSVAEPVISDSGVVTAISNTQGTISITDTTKAWTINQWVGYQVRITFGSGLGQVRRVLYNTATVLTLGDYTKSADDIFNNPGIFSPAISSTAGSQSFYTIESSVATMDTAWAITPDTTSRFRVISGSIFLISSAASAPYYTLQQYDILSDTWYIRTACSNILAAVGAEGSMEYSGEIGATWFRSQATAGTSTSLTDTTQSWVTNELENYWLYIFSGTGTGQIRQISSNTTNSLTWATSGTAPDTTSQYVIVGFTAGTVTTGGSSSLTDSTQNWTTNQWANYSVKILAGTGAGQIVQIASNTATVLTFVKSVATALDTTSIYEIITDPDKIYVHVSGNTPVFLHNIEDDVPTFGRNQDSGTARIGSISLSTSNTAYGTFKPQAISTITYSGTTATVTTVNSHNFQVGQSILISGATSTNATLYNGTFTVVSVPSTTTLTYTMSSTPSGNATFSALSTTVLVDATKNWTTNQWANYLVTFTDAQITAATGATTILTGVITSNTANTLTLQYAASLAPTNGISRYVITPNKAVGISPYTNTVSTGDNGVATSGSTTTIVNTNAAWTVNIYAGRRVKFTGGSGQGQEGLITANTATTLTFNAVTTAAAAGTTYSILANNVWSTGSNLQWAIGQTLPGNNGYANQIQYPNDNVFPQTPQAKYIFIARGGATVGFYRLDITTDYFTVLTQTPQLETLTGGSMYAYDGNNRIYFTKIDATNTQHRIYYLDINTYWVHGAGMVPWTVPTAINGNRMEIFTTIDGLNYLWLQRGSFTEVFRQLLFY